MTANDRATLWSRLVIAAALNMGDCFSYACAKTNRARLLYKGEDFARTDRAWHD